MLAIVLEQKVPSFSLLELKRGFVEVVFTQRILPEIRAIYTTGEPLGRSKPGTP